jgi:transposase
LKAATLEKLQCAARDGQCRLFYLDEAGFRAAPPVQRSWSPRGLPHSIEPNSHCRRNVVAALNFGENSFIYAASACTVKGPNVVEFLDSLIRQGDGRPTVIVLDNASVHHSIDQHTLDRWFIDHKALLFYLPPYSPELNLIEIVWKHMKYHWRRFVTWTKETIDAELAELLSGYGTKFQVNFS